MKLNTYKGLFYMILVTTILIAMDCESLHSGSKGYTKIQILDKIQKYEKYIENDSCMITYFTLINLFSMDPTPYALDILKENIFELKRNKAIISLRTIASKFSSSFTPKMRNLSDDEYVDEVLVALKKNYMVGIDFSIGKAGVGNNHFLQLFKPVKKSNTILVLQSFQGDYHLKDWIDNDDYEVDWNSFKADLLVIISGLSTFNQKLDSLYNISFRGKMRNEKRFRTDSDEWWTGGDQHGIITRIKIYPIDIKREPNIDSLRENSNSYIDEKSEELRKKKRINFN